ncbi:carboxypeptidase-like regulatory domain-containing protein, partial [uncultured Bacteroides sp.]|uniref:carboxypeptidase-like regulatory domain-containing protein n=1 Tax=uncultured Bacteroides sp. TaxID=162156 RepID=UPI0026215423
MVVAANESSSPHADAIESILQQKTINGKVLDATGEPIIGANVLVKGTTNGTITDIDGKFTLNVPTECVLQISYIGFNTQEIKVTS